MSVKNRFKIHIKFNSGSAEESADNKKGQPYFYQRASCRVNIF